MVSDEYTKLRSLAEKMHAKKLKHGKDTAKGKEANEAYKALKAQLKHIIEMVEANVDGGASLKESKPYKPRKPMAVGKVNNSYDYARPPPSGGAIIPPVSGRGRGAKGQKRAKRPGSGANNRWLQHCKAYHAAHPHLKYREVLQEARESYPPAKGGYVNPDTRMKYAPSASGGFIGGTKVPGMKDSDYNPEGRGHGSSGPIAADRSSQY